MRAFKSRSAIAANRALGRIDEPFWQRNYYERIIRNDDELDRIRAYIANNPAKWQDDEDNPDRLIPPHP
jgi:REP element-mobilizing transposase RayT